MAVAGAPVRVTAALEREVKIREKWDVGVCFLAEVQF